MAKTVKAQIDHIVTVRSEAAGSSDLIKAINNLSRKIEPALKQSRSVEKLAREVSPGKATGRASDFVLGRTETNPQAARRLRRTLLELDKIVKDTPNLKLSENAQKLVSRFRDFDKTQRELYSSTGKVNRNLKDNINLLERETLGLSKKRIIQQRDAVRARRAEREAVGREGLVGSLIRRGLGSGLIAGGVATTTQAVVAEAQFRGRAPLTRASELTQAMISTQNEVRKHIAQGVTAGLAGVGFLLGGPIGAGIGALIGTIFSAHVAAANAATAQAYKVGRAGAFAYLTAESPQSQMVRTRIHDSRYPINLPGNLSALYHQRGSLPFMASFVEANPSLRQFGMGLNPGNEFFKHMEILKSMGIHTQNLAAPIALLSAVNRGQQGGTSAQNVNSMLNLVTGLSRQTGVRPEQIASLMATLTQTTAMGTPQSASQFVKNTMPFGPAFQRTAIAFQQQGPLEQFKQKMIMGAFFPDINIQQLHGRGTMAQISHERMKFRKDIETMNRQAGPNGIQMGSIFGELASGSATNYYALTNDPHPTSQTISRSQEAAPNMDWEKLMGPSMKEALTQVKEMRVHQLVLGGSSMHILLTNQHFHQKIGGLF